jgi:hypothetical protein
MHIDKRAERLLSEHVSEGPDDETLTTRQVSDWLGVSEQWLEIARGRGTGPRFVQYANRIVKYCRQDVRAWLRKRVHQRTSEYAKVPRSTRR